MQGRVATAEDCPTLAELNAQLIRDEGHLACGSCPALGINSRRNE